MATPEPITCDRHCAYCLKFLPVGTAKICGRCYRRAYCSRDCQKADWSQKPGSQGHKNWCDLRCGEEDIEWEFKPAPGTGFGIFAKRFIPAKFRIMVDACRQRDHPAINDLPPIGAALDQKILMSSLGRHGKGPRFALICLRIARLGHDCDPNSDHFYDSVHHVKVAYAERDIQAGEEITKSFTSVNAIGGNAFVGVPQRGMLQMFLGIVCKENCICRDENIGKIIKESEGLNEYLIMAANSLDDTDNAMKMLKKQLGNLDTIHASLIYRLRTLHIGFHIGISRRSTLDEGRECARQAYELWAAIAHPKSEEVLQFKQYYENPSSDEHYLRLEK